MSTPAPSSVYSPRLAPLTGAGGTAMPPPLTPSFALLSADVPSGAAAVAASPAQTDATSVISAQTTAASSDQFTKLTLAEYVKAKGGNKPIDKILIANNGIAAVKAIRSIRRWAYETFGNDRMVEFVVMATPEDLKANAAYIHLADEFVQVPGGSNNNNYANIRLIADIAERTGAQAVWPGWGHASENDRLPELLAETKNGVVWIGPPPAAMRALGDKIGSTLIAQSAGVPCMDWSGAALKVEYQKEGIPKDLYQQACVHSASEAASVCERLGFPVMIKASEGGGGKGIRKVEAAGEVAHAFAQVQGEVPGSPVFIMKLAPACRHLEVQLLADRHHEAIAIFGRDCSIQRRHQKIIEEGPVVAAPPDVWRHMEQSAVKLAKEVGYTGAGTVEYLYLEDGTYYFLELNPRLQVEHPVTELISGVNLPAAQLQIAMGIPLHNLRGVRRMYGEHPDTDTPIDFANRQARTLPGHVIACRITAENPDSSFQPTSGVIQELNFRSTPDVWGYFSVAAKGGIHEYSDSQFGHMFALGETREIARRNMVLAIKELSIRGDIRTTVEYLRMILETEDFRANRLSTTWLERLMSARAVMTEKPPVEQTILLGALWRTYKYQEAKQKEYMAMLERGQLPPPSLHQELISHSLDLIYDRTKYALSVDRASASQYELRMNGWSGEVEVHTLADEGLLCLLAGKKHVVYGQEFPSGLRLVIDGKTCLFAEEYDPTQLRSSMPGKLVRYLVQEGAHVTEGQAYAEIEVMKMYISLPAPEDGFLHQVKPEGAIIEAGDLLATLVLDHPERVQKAELFTGTFPPTMPPNAVAQVTAASGDITSPEYINNHVNLTLKESLRRLENLLDGWALSSAALGQAVRTLFASLRAAVLPLEQFREALSSITSRVPAKLGAEITSILDTYEKRIIEQQKLGASSTGASAAVLFPVTELQAAIDATLASSSVTEEDKIKLRASLASSGFGALLATYQAGPTETNQGYALATLRGLFDAFLRVEEKFNGRDAAETPEFVIKSLRKVHGKDDLSRVAAIARAHHQLKKRNELVVLLLDSVQRELPDLLESLLPTMKELTQLNSMESGNVVLKARQIIMAWRHRAQYEDGSLVGPESPHTDPVTAAQLDLVRLANYDLHHLATTNRQIVLFAAYPAKEEGKGQMLTGEKVPPSTPLPAASASATVYDGRRFFIRTLVRKLGGSTSKDGTTQGMPPPRGSNSSLVQMGESSELDAYPETEFAFVEALNALEIAMGDAAGPAGSSPFKFNAIFLNVLVSAAIDVKYIEAVIRLMARKYAPKMRRLFVAMFEFKIALKDQQADLLQEANSGWANGNGAKLSGDKDGAIAYRFVATNPTGYNLLVDTYQELTDASTGRNYFKLVNHHYQHGRSTVYAAAGGAASPKQSPANWDGLETTTPYPVSMPFQRQRQIAQAMDTVYVYDFLPLLEHALAKIWKTRYQVMKYAAETSGRRKPSMQVGDSASLFSTTLRRSESLEDLAPTTLPERESAYAELKSEEEAALRAFMPSKLLQAVELVLATDAEGRVTLVEQERVPGQATIGMVAWLLTLYTPEVNPARQLHAANPSAAVGRQVVLIANDITHQAGTFGPQEDLLFDLASKYARAHRLPRWYFSANSGARIGLAEELRHKFRIAWQDEQAQQQSKGGAGQIAYLYLTEADYAAHAKSVHAQRVEVPGTGEVRYAIKDIIGARDGLGVENLRGSGTIAGETSRAYDEIFTLTFVTSRSVGIGAYLARLGQRVIQKNPQPIILTGFSALNKLLGKAVYTSNVQLGGPDIMYTNGVSHWTVEDDMEGVLACLKWLSYVPARRGLQVPMLPSGFADAITRPIDFVPTTRPYDPRHMLAGCKVTQPDGSTSWLTGFLDRDSFTELLGGWARTVVVGRGRLGGMPLGVIAVETRTVEQVIPADPASPDSKEHVQQRAGQVWYPDSAFKTAQGIRDCAAEDLPLLIFANWRGFSGGQKDMFEEVLKFGAYIVDALRDYRQPIMVYLPPQATLRGGAWVVVDQTINEAYMEMYADESARGGVLETEGTLDVKFRKKDILATAHRLDAKLQALDAELKAIETGGASATARTKDVVSKEIRARETLLFPVYHQAATQFADLHDTPGRMQAKGCLQGEVPWARAREFFFYRFQRKMIEARYVKRIVAVLNECTSASTAAASSIVVGQESWRAARALFDSWTASAPTQSDQGVFEWCTVNAAVLESKLGAWKSTQLLARMQQLILATTTGSHEEPASTVAASSDVSSSLVDSLASVITALKPEQKEALKKLFA